MCLFFSGEERNKTDDANDKTKVTKIVQDGFQEYVDIRLEEPSNQLCKFEFLTSPFDFFNYLNLDPPGKYAEEALWNPDLARSLFKNEETEIFREVARDEHGSRMLVFNDEFMERLELLRERHNSRSGFRMEFPEIERERDEEDDDQQNNYLLRYISMLINAKQNADRALKGGR